MATAAPSPISTPFPSWPAAPAVYHFSHPGSLFLSVHTFDRGLVATTPAGQPLPGPFVLNAATRYKTGPIAKLLGETTDSELSSFNVS